MPAAGGGGTNNRFGFEEIDHVTSNFQTMKPMLLWIEHVLGFEQLWEVAFHTNDVDAAAAQDRLGPQVDRDVGSRSRARSSRTTSRRGPFFKSSQINIFNEELRGDGVQHVALTVTDILSRGARAARARRRRSCRRPGTYYDMLPERLEKSGIEQIDEDIETLRELEILVDGDQHHAYMLQIFLKESAGLYDDPRRARSSTRSSSARATAASAPATSARCSRASSASSASEDRV